jgi:hypothetical protein
MIGLGLAEIIVLAVILVAAVAVGLYFALRGGKDDRGE